MASRALSRAFATSHFFQATLAQGFTVRDVEGVERPMRGVWLA
jgi:hypothetical protein